MSARLDSRRRLMREVNDRIYEILGADGSEDGDFLCECGSDDCRELVQLTLREYAAIQTETNPVLVLSRRHSLVKQ